MDIRTDVPHSARVWNHWRGGKDNVPADREVGDQFAALYPDITAVARGSRAFLTRAVTFLAAERGIRQFLDIGTGLHDPDTILDLAGRTTLDLGEPVGLILMNILGHVSDLADAAAIVRRLLAALPSGSYLVTADGTNVLDGPAFEQAIAGWNANAPLAYRLRSPEEIATYLDGLELVEPGLVPCARWRPDPAASPADLRPVDEYGAVARKP